MRDILGYEGKRVVVVGAASGMGLAATKVLVDLGAEVYALDVQEMTTPVKQYIRIDLTQRQSIESAVEQVPGDVYGLFHCAGLPGAPFSNLDTMLVNFVGQRHFTEALLPRIQRRGSVSIITSVAGMGYAKNMDSVAALLATPDFDAGKVWCEANPEAANGYLFSKQCIIVYTKQRAHELASREIRFNCVSPAPTDTPMLKAFHDQVSKEFLEEHFLAPVGRNATPEEMAEPLVFLGSNAARFVSGVNLFVDYGYSGGVDVGARVGLL